MWKIETSKFTAPQRGGKDPDIIVTRRRYLPVAEADRATKKHLKKKSKDKPIDYGITKEQFYDILKKASQPTKETKSDSEKAQT